jgi:hypothetical protein
MSRVPLDFFFPIWDPEDIDNLIEVYVVTTMTAEQAKLKYSITAESGRETVEKVEHWTQFVYETTVDNRRIDQFSGVNPWGLVPFVYIPRMRSHIWWGDSLTEDIQKIQDELNMRLADLGDSINYSTHPIRYGFNLPHSFKPENYPVGPNVFWDLGRVVGNSEPPTVGILEAKQPIPAGTENYINFVFDWVRTSSFAPPISFGEDNGGGQRSGATLEIRLWPLVKATKRSRAYMTSGLNQIAKMIARILKQKSLTDVPARIADVIMKGLLIPTWAPILPRDQAGIIDQLVKQLSTKVPVVSIETAVKEAGWGTSEVERIKDMLSDPDLKEFWQPKQPEKPKGMDSATGAPPTK